MKSGQDSAKQQVQIDRHHSSGLTFCLKTYCWDRIQHQNKSSFEGIHYPDLRSTYKRHVGTRLNTKTSPDLQAPFIWTYVFHKNHAVGTRFNTKTSPNLQAPSIWTHVFHENIMSGPDSTTKRVHIYKHHLSGVTIYTKT